MRIVSGEFGGRRLIVPKGRDIRPTSDKIRGAVFNMLRSREAVDGAHVLDAFCGSGALGLEALSQGAQHVTFVDKNRESLDLARQNAEQLGVFDRASFILKDTTRITELKAGHAPADLVFVDPPYNKGLVSPALDGLCAAGWVADGAWIVCETEKNFNGTFPSGIGVQDEKAYGDTKIFLCRYEKS